MKEKDFLAFMRMMGAEDSGTIDPDIHRWELGEGDEGESFLYVRRPYVHNERDFSPGEVYRYCRADGHTGWVLIRK